MSKSSREVRFNLVTDLEEPTVALVFRNPKKFPEKSALVYINGLSRKDGWYYSPSIQSVYKYLPASQGRGNYETELTDLPFLTSTGVPITIRVWGSVRSLEELCDAIVIVVSGYNPGNLVAVEESYEYSVAQNPPDLLSRMDSGVKWPSVPTLPIYDKLPSVEKGAKRARSILRKLRDL